MEKFSKKLFSLKKKSPYLLRERERERERKEREREGRQKITLI